MSNDKIILEYETMDIVKKRVELLAGARLKSQKRVRSASLKIDELREKYGDVEKGYDSVKIIRKWRDSR